jgi:anti-sigma B factor antagonist
MSLDVTSSVVGGRPVVALAGTVDLATVPSLHNALTTAILDNPHSAIAIDLGAVESLDDVALGVLLGAAGRARRAGGDLVVIAPDDALRRRLALTGFDRAISVSATLSTS